MSGHTLTDLAGGTVTCEASTDPTLPGVWISFVDPEGYSMERNFTEEEVFQFVEHLAVATAEAHDAAENGYACSGVGEAVIDDDDGPCELGDTRQYILGDKTDRHDRLRNKLTIPVGVYELRKMIDGAKDDDIIELQIPLD